MLGSSLIRTSGNRKKWRRSIRSNTFRNHHSRSMLLRLCPTRSMLLRILCLHIRSRSRIPLFEQQ